MSQPQPPNSKKKPSDSPLRQYAQYTSLGFQMLAVILVGVFIGKYLDGKFPNEKSIWTMVCVFVAVVMALVGVVVKLVRENK